MSIIKAKTSFRGVCECKHTPFRPFKNDTTFLLRPLTPFLVDDMDEDEHEDDDEGGVEEDGVVGDDKILEDVGGEEQNNGAMDASP